MDNLKKVRLKRGKEIPVKKMHHWIFSGGIEKVDKFQNGDFAQIYSFKGELLGHGYLNKDTVIAVRMINFTNEDPFLSIKNLIYSAINLRVQHFDSSLTNTFRLVNAEGDFLPGLTVDLYKNVLVIQISTIGIDRIKNFIINCLIECCSDLNIKIESILEKSEMSSRKIDGLEKFKGFVWGKEIKIIEVIENGIKFQVDLWNSQKTGLFLDMREMRQLVSEISSNLSVLNCFSYTGGFSLYAHRGDAKNVTSVDISKDAIENSKKNFEINQYNGRSDFFAEDVFRFIENNDLKNYDLVILDPPAFAKSKKDVENAKRGYFKLNKIALNKMKKNSLLLSCSCSSHISEEDLENEIKNSALSVNRKIRILQKHRLAFDHPINIYHKELSYLKSFLLFVE